MTPSELEDILTNAYRREAACYDRALQAAQSIDDALRQSRTAPLEGFLALLDEVAAIEAEIRAAKQEWQRLARPLGPALLAARDQVADLIQTLQARVGSAEQQARAVGDRLVPQLDQLVRGRQMQSAYRGTMAMRLP